jgi:alanyl-tRNA synthetase
VVTDVQVDDDGRVHHVVEGDLPEIGVEVRGEIDMACRRDHMMQHTCQHVLSRALLEIAGARTVSSRLGETVCTIDVDLVEITRAQVEEAERLVNEVIEQDRPVRAYFPEPEDLATLALRRRPKVDREVRVVEVGGFDLVPCGGTHCTRTSQVGLVKILGTERYKGMTRITFVAGGRARVLLGEHFDVLSGLGRELTCGALDVPAAVDKLRRELGVCNERLKRARTQLAEAVARSLSGRAAQGLVSAALEDADADFLRAVGKRLTVDAGAVALLAAPGTDGTAVFAARGSKSEFDCGAFVKAVARATGGRGGGRPDHAEGRLPPDVDWSALVAEHGRRS